jgi:hypothetical protein
MNAAMTFSPCAVVPCYNHGAAWADRHELIWGDYYLTEALALATDRVG